MKRLSKGRLKMAGVGTKTREWGGCSGWYNRRSPACRWDHHSGPFWEIYLPGRGHQRHQSRRVETLSLLHKASRKEELQEVLLLKKPRTCKRRWLSTRQIYYRTKPPDKIDTYSRNNFDEHKVGILWFRGAAGWRLWRLGLDQESGVLEICLASLFKSWCIALKLTSGWSLDDILPPQPSLKLLKHWWMLKQQFSCYGFCSRFRDCIGGAVEHWYPILEVVYCCSSPSEIDPAMHHLQAGLYNSGTLSSGFGDIKICGSSNCHSSCTFYRIDDMGDIPLHYLFAA